MRDFNLCPKCFSHMVKATAINDGESINWLKCTRCSTYVNTYVPMPHQQAVHEDPHTFIGNFGGYGSGKTTTSTQEVYKHILITPNANVLISANIAAQYEMTIKRDIEADFPKDFVKKVNTQKQYIEFINGARIMFRPLDDPDKLRSLNLSMFVIVEASETDGGSFEQLKTRLRNMAAAVPELDEDGNQVVEVLENGAEIPKYKTHWLKGIIESNPDSGWIRSQVLYCADDIQIHGEAVDEYVVMEDKKDPKISAHVTTTHANPYLPPDFIQQISLGKPVWWLKRYVYGSFSYAEGLVYPNASGCIVPRYELPSNFKRIIAADYGLSDNFVYLFGAIDEYRGKIIIYKEVVTNNRNIEELSRLFFAETVDIPMGAMYCQPILDPKSGAKRDYNKKTLYDHFLDHGIYFQPGHIQVDARVFRLNTYIESGKLEIMDCCHTLIEELQDYKFPPKKLDGPQKGADKPVDKNNHCINPLEWITMALPANPKNLMYGAYDEYGRDLTKPLESKPMYIPLQLQDTEQYDPTGGMFSW